jgi:NitT/TauT family transport system substrate-binding protein
LDQSGQTDVHQVNQMMGSLKRPEYPWNPRKEEKIILNGFRKRFTPVFLLVIILFIGQHSYGTELGHQKPVKLKVIALPFMSYAPFYVAEEEGYFAEQKLQIEFVKMTDAIGALPLLIKGDIDVWSDIIYPSCLNSMIRGAKIKIVADKGHLSATGCNYTVFMARRALIEEGKLDSLSRLKGLRVATTQGSALSGYYLEKLLSKVGLTVADIQLLFLLMPNRADAFERGSLDVAMVVEPWVTKILQKGHAAVWIPIQQVAPNFQQAVLLYGPTLLEKNPEAGNRFMVAYLKAVRQVNQGKTERNIKTLAKYTGLDQELLKKTCWPAFRNDGQINIESVNDFQNWVFKKGLIDTVISPNQFWDPNFIEYANKVLGPAKN